MKFSGASWTKDGKGFFYSRYDEPKGTALRDANYFQKLYYHQIGTAQAEDKLIYERPDNKELGFSGVVTDDGHYLIIHGLARDFTQEPALLQGSDASRIRQW